MGYITIFSGALFFNEPLSEMQKLEIEQYLGEDFRDHSDWKGPNGATYIDLKFVYGAYGKAVGLQWNPYVEKTHHLTEIVQFIVDTMREKGWPSFGVTGELEAQGEDPDDRWFLRATKDGNVEEVKGVLVPCDQVDLEDYADWVEEGWNGHGSHPIAAKRPIEINERDLTIMSLGLAGETGEVIEILKKRVRDGKFDPEDFKLEMGDVLFYWCRLARAFNVTPTEIIKANVEKLNKRRAKKAEKND